MSAETLRAGRRVYLDHAATTPVDARVLAAMLPYFSEKFGNPNSPHAFGREAVTAVDDARDTVAACIGAKANEVYFTSGGTEADNWALAGIMRASAERGRHFIVSAVEHHAVLEAARALCKEGFSCSVAPVDGAGAVDVAALKGLLRPDTVLVCLMAANNEVGTVQPLAEVSALCRERGILLFSDAVQAAGTLPVNVNSPRVDLLSLSSHKLYGPKGAGALYVRSGVKIAPLLFGGRQERGRRGGTVNVPACVGFAGALRLCAAEREQEHARLFALRERFARQVLAGTDALRNGDAKHSLPGVVSFTFDGTDGEAVLYALDLAGVAASGGAACSSGAPEPSHVLLAMGRSEAQARASVRFSFGRENTEEDADFAAETVVRTIQKLRARRAEE